MENTGGQIYLDLEAWGDRILLWYFARGVDVKFKFYIWVIQLGDFQYFEGSTFPLGNLPGCVFY